MTFDLHKEEKPELLPYSFCSPLNSPDISLHILPKCHSIVAKLPRSSLSLHSQHTKLASYIFSTRDFIITISTIKPAIYVTLSLSYSVSLYVFERVSERVCILHSDKVHTDSPESISVIM